MYLIDGIRPNAYYESVQSILDASFNITDMELVTSK